MSLPQLLQDSTKWLSYASIALCTITLISFFLVWGQRFRLLGITAFTILLAGSSWTFSASYNPPLIVEGAVYVPVVYDNGDNLVVAQVPNDFPNESIYPTLDQLAGNLKGRGRNNGQIHVRLRGIEDIAEGVSRPTIIGEVVRDLNQEVTTRVTLKPSGD